MKREERCRMAKTQAKETKSKETEGERSRKRERASHGERRKRMGQMCNRARGGENAEGSSRVQSKRRAHQSA